MSHEFTTLHVSRGTYQEIRRLMEAAGLDYDLNDIGEIDMTGVIITIAKNPNFVTSVPLYDYSEPKVRRRRSI